MKKYIPIILILIVAGFLRFYKINNLMIFHGDVARDYLTARDITIKGILPLVGCPSSIVWLHQGSLFLYLLGIVLWIGKYNPVSGAYFVGTLGVLGVLGVFILGKKLFSEKVGLWSAFFYATSPLIVVFDRYPYHQSLISLFIILFFLCLYYTIKINIKYLILTAFILGLLLQLEISNIILIPVLLILLVDYRKMLKFKITLLSFLAFSLTWTPKIIYDFKNGFSQTVGFAIWILYRILPVRLEHKRLYNLSFTKRMESIAGYFSEILFWPSIILSVLLLTVILIFLFKGFPFKKRKMDFSRYLLVIWFIVPLFALLLHGAPSLAYMPVYFGLISLLVGYFIVNSRNFGLKTLFLLLILFNGYFVIKNDYFVLTRNNLNQKNKIYFSQSLGILNNMAEYIVNKSDSKPYNIIPLGEYNKFESNINDMNYLTWYLGNPPSVKEEKIKFYIYNNEYKDIYRKNAEVEKFPYMTIVKEE